MRNKYAKVSDPNDFSTPCGSSSRIIYSSKVTPNGMIILTPTGKEDIQEKMDSFRESTDMSFILHQLSVGNTSVLTNKQMMFGDFTEAPANLAEAQQLLIDGEAAFNKLPLDVRSKFDNNFRNWLFTSGTEEWMQKMDKLIEKKEEVSEEKESDSVDVS